MTSVTPDAIAQDLRVLVHPGLERGFADLQCLQHLGCARQRLKSTTPAGQRAAVRRLIDDAIHELQAMSSEYAEAARALLALGEKTQTTQERRKLAGKALRVEGATFRRHHEPRVLLKLAEIVVLLEDGADHAPQPQEMVDISWEVIQTTLRSMHREIQQKMQPDVVLTMSGPGSFAAFLCLSMDPHDVPVVACTTFPRRERPTPSQQVFDRALDGMSWRTIETSKWVVYIPDVMDHFPSRSRILIFDDRVISGDTQRLARTALEAEGYDVRTAGMIVDPKSVTLVDFYGLVVDRDYTLPWGTRRGRT